uniref:Uncharacterized protein n=1 Tax=Aquila chrysaetos chrysaetos TaxID=223781 RepID=A0A663F275_AQUCH
MMTRGAGTAFSRKSYRLSLGPEKSKLTGMGLTGYVEDRPLWIWIGVRAHFTNSLLVREINA